jgi:hypothetical protein
MLGESFISDRGSARFCTSPEIHLSFAGTARDTRRIEKYSGYSSTLSYPPLVPSRHQKLPGGRFHQFFAVMLGLVEFIAQGNEWVILATIVFCSS